MNVPEIEMLPPAPPMISWPRMKPHKYTLSPAGTPVTCVLHSTSLGVGAVIETLRCEPVAPIAASENAASAGM